MPERGPWCGSREVPVEAVCEKCGGDGYTETWNAEQSDVVITLCTDCGPSPGEAEVAR